ncbi:MAG: hypothetical protein IKJ32_01010 [Clostridia bacterium]|nr:hypothetical protein [Clostridia bacterium]
MAAKRIVTIILAVILVVAIVLAVIPATRNAIGGWFTSIFSSEDKPGDDPTVPTDDPNATTPEGNETAGSADGETGDSTDGEETGDKTIADLPAEERMAAIQKMLNEIAAREDGDNEYTPEELLVLTMHFVVTEDGKILESGHNMAAPGVETYAMDTFPGSWEWAEIEGDVKVPVFLSGHKLSVAQTGVATNSEYVPVDDQPIEIAVCKHGNGLLSGYFVRTQGDLEVVTFSAESFNALKTAFRWWYETDENGDQIIKIGFAYCNDAPEGVEGVIPVIVPSPNK